MIFCEHELYAKVCMYNKSSHNEPICPHTKKLPPVTVSTMEFGPHLLSKGTPSQSDYNTGNNNTE